MECFLIACALHLSRRTVEIVTYSRVVRLGFYQGRNVSPFFTSRALCSPRGRQSLHLCRFTIGAFKPETPASDGHPSSRMTGTRPTKARSSLPVKSKDCALRHLGSCSFNVASNWARMNGTIFLGTAAGVYHVRPALVFMNLGHTHGRPGTSESCQAHPYMIFAWYSCAPNAPL